MQDAEIVHEPTSYLEKRQTLARLGRVWFLRSWVPGFRSSQPQPLPALTLLSIFTVGPLSAPCAISLASIRKDRGNEGKSRRFLRGRPCSTSLSCESQASLSSSARPPRPSQAGTAAARS